MYPKTEGTNRVQKKSQFYSLPFGQAPVSMF